MPQTKSVRKMVQPKNKKKNKLLQGASENNIIIMTRNILNRGPGNNIGESLISKQKLVESWNFRLETKRERQ